MEKTTETLSPGTKTAGKADRRGKARAWFFAILLLLVLVFCMAYSTYKQFEVERENAYDSLRDSMHSLRSLITFEGNLEESFAEIRDVETYVFSDLGRPFFDYLGVTRETLNTFQFHWESDTLYYFADDGSTLTTDNAAPFPLDKSQTHMLKTVGILNQEEWTYNAVRLKDGWLIVKWPIYPNIYSVDFERISKAVPSDLCIIQNTTGEVLISSTVTPYNFLDESRVTFEEVRYSDATEGIQAGYLKEDGFLSGIYFVKSRLMNRYSVFVYVPLSTVILDTLDKTMPVHILLIIIFFFIWFCSRKIRKQGLAQLEQFSFRRIGKKHCLHLSLLRQMIPLLLSGILAAMIFTTYLPLLTNYINHNVRMEKKLDAFVKEIQINDEEWEKMETIYHRVWSEQIYMIDLFSDIMGEDFTQEVLVDLARRMNMQSVVIYNSEGVSTLSTGLYVGYKLSQDPEDSEYALWEMLRNADTSMMGELPDKSGFFAASRRFFKVPGLIYVAVPDDRLLTMKEETDINTALQRINTDTYGKMHTYMAAPETFIWSNADSPAVRTINNTLPKTALMNRYCGTQTVNGYRYYLNTMTDDNHVLISVEQLSVFTDPIKKSMALIIPELLLCSLIILCATCICPCDRLPAAEMARAASSRIRRPRGEEKEKELPSPEEQQLRYQVRKYCSKLVWLLCTLLVIFYFGDKLSSAHPMSDYLFSRQWQREPSIFSLTTILLSLLFLFVGMRFLRMIMRGLSSRMDSRAETFGDLILSIIQFLLTVAVIVYSLHELGVDTTVILTSAGVISLIIGYGSQSIVSDLVSGVFLIMEDQVRIGEFIEIDGFMGKVENIGLRTTRATYDSRMKIISNSNMVNFYNLSRVSTPAKWTIGVPMDADIDRVRTLIEGSRERFKEEVGDKLVGGPVYEGLSRVRKNGRYILTYRTYCKVEDWEDVQAASLETAFRILKENGIEPVGGSLLPI